MAEQSFFYLNLLSVTCKHGDPINIQEFFSYFLDQILFLLIHEWMDGEIFFSTFCQLPFQQKKKKSKRKLVIFSFYGIYLISSARFLFLISFYIDFLFCLFVWISNNIDISEGVGNGITRNWGFALEFPWKSDWRHSNLNFGVVTIFELCWLKGIFWKAIYIINFRWFPTRFFWF